MDTHGYPRISMDIHGYPWIPMGTHGRPWRYMSAPGSELHDGWGVSFITTVSFITNIIEHLKLVLERLAGLKKLP